MILLLNFYIVPHRERNILYNIYIMLVVV